MPANIEFVDAESMGATSYGAYSPEDGGTIYLDARLKDKPELMLAVFNEELGHHLDNELGGSNASGDEGAIFAQSLKSGPLDQISLKALKAEQDHGFIDVDGEQVDDLGIFNRVASYHDKNTIHVDYKPTGNQGQIHDNGNGWVHIP